MQDMQLRRRSSVVHSNEDTTSCWVVDIAERGVLVIRSNTSAGYGYRCYHSFPSTELLRSPFSTPVKSSSQFSSILWEVTVIVYYFVLPSSCQSQDNNSLL